MTRRSSPFTLCLSLLLLGSSAPQILSAQTSPGAAGESAREALPATHRDFLLDGPYLQKAHLRSRDLVAADLNGNGLVDLAVVTNERSLLEIFHQREEAERWEDRFEKNTVTLDRIIRGVVAADVNGNGRTDLLMAASPSRLVVMYQDTNGRLQPPRETTLEADRIVAGDLTGNGHEDILVQRDRRMKILHGGPRGIELEPAEVFFTSGDPLGTPMILDFDGDGLSDIVYADASRSDELVVRLQSPERTFPSEFRLRTSSLRSVAPLPAIGGTGRASIAAIQNQTRHLVQLSLAATGSGEEAGPATLPLSRPQLIPFNPEQRSNRSETVSLDVDGDGRPDLIVYSPDLPLLRTLRQTRGGTLRESTSPSLEGVTQLIPFPAAGGEKTPLVLFSAPERAVGFAVYSEESESLPFPRLHPVAGQPRAITLMHDGDGVTLAMLTTETVEGEQVTTLAGYPLSREGTLGERENLSLTANEDEETEDPLAGALRGRNPTGMAALDLNRNGRQDLVVYIEFRPALLLLREEEGFRVLEAGSGVLEGLLSGARPGTIQEARLDGADGPPVTLALKDRFVRAFAIDEEHNVVVEDQFNGRNTDSRLIGMATGAVRGGERPEVVLLDRGNRVLTILGADEDGEYDVLTNLELGGTDYFAVRAVDLDGDGRDDVILTADDRIAILYGAPAEGALDVRATAPPENDQGGYGGVYTAELVPGQGHEILAVEMREHLLDFFVPGRDAEDRPALHRFYSFKMFDSDASIARRPNLDAPPEPREVISADLNGDGRMEIIALTHDNIIVYHQAENEE